VARVRTDGVDGVLLGRRPVFTVGGDGPGRVAPRNPPPGGEPGGARVAVPARESGPGRARGDVGAGDGGDQVTAVIFLAGVFLGALGATLFIAWLLGGVDR
jgi:hypothetical protein